MSANRSNIFGAPPVLMGHRGMGRGVVNGHKENTVGSFLAAAEVVPWVEVDVRRTADDILTVYHNPAMPSGQPIATATAADVEAAGLTLLAELLAVLPADVGVNLEIKSALEDALREPPSRTAGLAAHVAAEAAVERPVLVSSFDPAALGIIADLAPEARRGLITWKRFPIGIAVAAATGLGVDVLCAHERSLTPNTEESRNQHPGAEHVLSVAHDADLEVLAWCPKPERTKLLAAAGVDAVCVNDPPAALRELRQV